MSQSSIDKKLSMYRRSERGFLQDENENTIYVSDQNHNILLKHTHTYIQSLRGTTSDRSEGKRSAAAVSCISTNVT